MFKKGQLAVYPAHGVGVIESEEEKHIGGLAQRFYILRILENDMIIMIPTDNADTVGLRPVIDQKQVSQVYSILKDRDVIIENQTWNRRYRDYMKKIKTGSVFEVAEVLRDLFSAQAGQRTFLWRAQDARHRARPLGEGAFHRPPSQGRGNRSRGGEDLPRLMALPLQKLCTPAAFKAAGVF